MIGLPVVTNAIPIPQTLCEDSVFTGEKKKVPFSKSCTREGEKGTRKREDFLLGRA